MKKKKKSRTKNTYHNKNTQSTLICYDILYQGILYRLHAVRWNKRFGWQSSQIIVHCSTMVRKADIRPFCPKKKVFLFFFFFFREKYKKKTKQKKEDTQNLYLKEYFNKDCCCYSEMKPIDSMLKPISVSFFLYSPGYLAVWRIICLHWLWPPHTQSSEDIAF